MPRRPLAIAAVSFAAGIAYRHLAADGTSFLILTLACCLVTGMFFYFACTWKNIEQIYKNGNTAGAPSSGETSGQSMALQEEASWDWDRAFKSFAAIVAVFFVTGALACHIAESRQSQIGDLYGQETELTGRIASVDVKADDKCSLVFQAMEAGPDHRKIYERIQVSVKGISAKEAADLAGRPARITGSPEEAEGASNPGAFDYRLYLRSAGIYSVMYAEACQIKAADCLPGLRFKIIHLASVFKENYEENIRSLIDDEPADLLFGILFGHDSFMDDDLKEAFQKNGTAHLLAASGLHVGFVYGLLHLLLGKPSGLRGNIPVIMALVVYAALAGFSASVVRAVFMITVHIVGRVRHRRYDFFNCTCFCLLALLAVRPENLFNSGFQLSFMAVMTLSLVLKRLEEPVPGICRALGDRRSIMVKPILSGAAGMLSLQLGMTPLSLYHFHYISLGALFLNAPAIALAGIIVPVGMLLIPLTWLGGPAAAFVCSMEEMLVRLLMALNDLTAGTPLSFRYAATPPAWVLMFYYICLFFLCSESGKKWLARRKRLKGPGCRGCGGAGPAAIFAGMVLVISLTWGFCLTGDYARADLVFVDVGQGDCAHLKAGSADILFDTGGKESFDSGTSDTGNDSSGTASGGGSARAADPVLGRADPDDPVASDILIPYLLGHGISHLDAVVLSHLHQDHCGALIGLAEAVEIKHLILPAVYMSQAEEISRESGIPAENLIFAGAGDVIKVGDAVLEVLTPPAGTAAEYAALLENSSDENDLSMVVRAEYRGKSVIFTGDIDSEYETELVNIYGNAASLLDCDILKAAHHGSRFSSCDSFLQAVSPEIAVIQVGTNYYGHPTEEAMARIRNSGSLLYRNDLQGAVMLSLKGRIRCFTMT